MKKEKGLSIAMQPAIFLDRDNTLVVDTGYIHKCDDFCWIEEAPEALRLFHRAGLPIFIITNQGGIAREYFTLADMQAFHHKLQSETQKIGAHITDIAYCPHHPQSITKALRTPCACRKPEPGMIYRLAEKWDIHIGGSIVIGDKVTDVEAGRRAGCHSFLLKPEQSLLRLAKSALKSIGL